MSQLQKLPIGIQTFADIRSDNYLYVDKTAQIFDLIDNGRYYFLSRPRRFGKSLLVSTMQALFEGRRELFDGLAIYDQWDWDITYPVIKLSFAGVGRNREEMLQDVHNLLRRNQERLGIACPQNCHGGDCLQYLIEHASKKYNQKVVILVDEYDKLIVDNLDQLDVAKEGREILKDLYTTIKDSDEYIKFAFLTGVSKFAKVSIFSGLNNLKDITLDKRYATICGYTQHDLDTTFAGHLAGVDMDKVRLWYNGYNFLGEPVYNPFDILKFIKSGHQFKNHWFASGTPTFLLKLLKQNRYFVPRVDNIEVTDSLIDSYDVENIRLEPILFQSGYLTIREQFNVGAITMYRLCFPNLETRYSFNDYILSQLLQQEDTKVTFQSAIYTALENGDVPAFEQALRCLFAAIPNNNHTRNNIASFEGYYASVIYAGLASLGLDIAAEDVTSTGRIDLTVKLNGHIYIMEFKVDGQDAALAQIKEKNYHAKYLNEDGDIYLIGIDFDSASRSVAGFEWERISSP